jgi:hypothetical protein
MTVVADVEETEELTFDVNSGARVSLENINGDITITGGSGEQVKVTAHKKAGNQKYLDELKVVADADADYVRIETRHPKHESGWLNWGDNGNGSVSYELSVPADVTLDAIETVNGDVRISAVDGTVKAGTVNGGLEVENLSAGRQPGNRQRHDHGRLRHARRRSARRCGGGQRAHRADSAR